MSRVLIVDDEPELLQVMRFMLELGGHEVTEASNTPQALGVLGSRKVDIVVTDLRMPGGGSGLELIRQARLLPDPVTCYILMTGFGDFATEELQELGVKQVFAKPFDMQEFVAAVGKAMA